MAAHVVDLAVRDAVELRASGDREDPDDFEVVLRSTRGSRARRPPRGRHAVREERQAGCRRRPRRVREAAAAAIGHLRPPHRRAHGAARLPQQASAAGSGWSVPSRAWVASSSRWGSCSSPRPRSTVLNELGADGRHRLPRGRSRAASSPSSSCPFVSLPKSTLTLAGGIHKTYLEGIREYLRLAEEDRLRAAQSPQTADLVSSGRRRIRRRAECPRRQHRQRVRAAAAVRGAVRDGARVGGGDPQRRASRGGRGTGVALRRGLVAFAVGRVVVDRPAGRDARSRAGSSSSSSSSSSWSSSGGSSGGGSSGGGGGGGGFGGR